METQDTHENILVFERLATMTVLMTVSIWACWKTHMHVENKYNMQYTLYKRVSQYEHV